MIFALGVPILGLLMIFDSSVINGEPRWLKPFKFFISVGIYNCTLEYLFRLYNAPETVRTFNACRWIIGLGMLFEVGLITLQAMRGEQSHFNVSTPFNSAVYGLMAVTIAVVVLATMVSAIVMWKYRKLAHPVISEAMLLGLTLTIIGSLQRLLMTQSPSEQLALIDYEGSAPFEGSRYVGAPPENRHTAPIVGWSRDVGDHRIAHFIGLHAIQFLLIAATICIRRGISRPRLTIRLASVAYFKLFVFALVIAHEGSPLF